MIIEARGDVVILRGMLSENHWPAIAAAVDLVLPEHPQGILIDCSQVTGMSEMGGATFMEGLNYMEARGARIILCNLPETIADRLRSIPGLHSQVPTAPTVEVARHSLEAAGSDPLTTRTGASAILVPVSPPFSIEPVLHLLARIERGSRHEIHLVYVVLVPRSLPVGAPLPDDENKAEAALSQAQEALSGTIASRHMVRGRTLPEALVEAASRLGIAEMIAGIDSSLSTDESVTEALNALRSRATFDLTLTQAYAGRPG